MAEILAKNPKAFDHFDEAKKKDPTLSEHLIVHKPWIDEVTWREPGRGGRRTAACPRSSTAGSTRAACRSRSGASRTRRARVEKFAEELPGRLHQRGDRSDARLVLLAAHDLDARLRRGDAEALGLAPTRGLPAPVQDVHRPRPRLRQGGQEGDASRRATTRRRRSSSTRCRWTSPSLDGEGGARRQLDEPGRRAHRARGHGGARPHEGAKVAVSCRARRGRRRSHELHGQAAQEAAAARVVVLHEQRSRSTLGASPTAQARREARRGARACRTTSASSSRDPSTPAPGADAFRWFFYASSPPWSNTRHSLSNVRALQKEFLVKLRNVYSFFTIYANIDGFDPSEPASRPEEDAQRARSLDPAASSPDSVRGVTARPRRLRRVRRDAADLVASSTRSRTGTCAARASASGAQTRASGRTTSAPRTRRSTSALDTLAALMAPFMPFTAEAMYQNLVVQGRSATAAQESVHLATGPDANAAAIDERLSREDRARCATSCASASRCARRTSSRCASRSGRERHPEQPRAREGPRARTST